MRACGIAGCTRRMALCVNVLYSIYALGVLVFATSRLFQHPAGELSVLARDSSGISERLDSCDV